MPDMEYRFEMSCPDGHLLPDDGAMAYLIAEALKDWAKAQGVQRPLYDVEVTDSNDDL